MPSLPDKRNIQQTANVPWVTLGTVVDTNDPQQMGRIRVVCPSLGDTFDADLVNIPWANYCAPFGGHLTRGYRGPEKQLTEGATSYGMWAIPKVGAQAVIMCLDGQVSSRVWMGTTYGQFLTHTLPVGRFLDDQTNGPASTTENPIEPLYTNMLQAFNNQNTSEEWKTRMAEKQAAGVRKEVVSSVASTREDERDNPEFRQGYQLNRLRPHVPHPEQAKTGGANLDPQIYSITTPGLHSFIMDDSLGNGRIRIRSTSGNQIIMDDTNERMYISTPEGENYVEMDRAGNVDIFSSRRISIHAEKDINMTTEGAFRVSAENIHMRARKDIRLHADENMYALATMDMTLHATQSLYLTGDSEMHSYSGQNMFIESGGELDVLSAEAMYVTATTGNLELKTGANDILINPENDLTVRANSGEMNFATYAANQDINMDSRGTGSEIHFNSGNADPLEATEADPATPVDETSGPGCFAYTTSRVPVHEPWGRISNNDELTDQDNAINDVSLVLDMTTTSSVLEIEYTNANANKEDLGDDLGRNENWRR